MRRTAALALALTLALGGCSTTEVAEATQGRRYEVEELNEHSMSLVIRVVTDTETGQRWLVASTTEGGVQIASMGRDIDSIPSNDDGE